MNKCEVTSCGKEAVIPGCSVTAHLCADCVDEYTRTDDSTRRDFVDRKNKPQPKKEEATVSDFKDTLKNDATDAGYRLAGRQLEKLTREPMVALIAGNDADATTRAKVAAFLKTDIGKAIGETLLSLGLSTIPSEHAQRLSKELRISAMTDVGDAVADLLMGPLRQVASDYLKGEPQALPAASANVKVPSFVDVVETVVVK